MKTTLASFVIMCALTMSAQSQTQTTLQSVVANDTLRCGVSEGVPGFSDKNADGDWSGLDVDFCRAVAAAIFNDASRVTFKPLPANKRFEALKMGEIDILARNTTWTMERETRDGIKFAAINYFDGQGFMVRKSLGITSALELSGGSVCTNTGTTTELNVTDYFRANKMELELVPFEKLDEAVKAYDGSRCRVYTTDASALYANRLKLTNPDDHVILPEIISKEPLAPSVRQGDDQWFTITKWVHYAMVNAEELKVTQSNADDMLKSTNPEIQRLLGVTGGFGQALGLSNDWAYRIIKQVGNYGESFDRNVGPDTPLGITRGVNALWSQGGLMYAPPIR